jgi:hypothetical protein
MATRGQTPGHTPGREEKARSRMLVPTGHPGHTIRGRITITRIRARGHTDHDLAATPPPGRARCVLPEEPAFEGACSRAHLDDQPCPGCVPGVANPRRLPPGAGLTNGGAMRLLAFLFGSEPAKQSTPHLEPANSTPPGDTANADPPGAVAAADLVSAYAVNASPGG